MSRVVTGDETFTRFRRKLEDAVLFAINNGKRVGKAHYCPLGCVPHGGGPESSGPAHPTVSYLLYNTTGVPLEITAPTEIELRQFALGFDDGGAYEGTVPAVGPYYQLGRLYRERFP